MKTIHFGPYRYVPSTGTLHKEGEQQVLRHQVNTLLKTFLSQADTLLSREELIAAVWPQQHVEANTFFQCMNHLRKALGDSSQDPQFIQNYPRKGYVWICPLQTFNPADPPSEKLGLSNQARVATLTLVVTLVGLIIMSRNNSVMRVSENHQADQEWSSKAHAQQPMVNQGELKPPSIVKTASTYRNNAKPGSQASPQTRISELRSDYAQAFFQAKDTFERGNPLLCEQLLQRILNQAHQDGYQQAQAMAHLALAKIARFRNPVEAKQRLHKVRAAYLQLQDQQKYTESTYILALVLLDLGEREQAQKLIENDLLPHGHRKRQQKLYYALAKGLYHLKSGDISMAEMALSHSKRHIRNSRNHKTHIQIAMLEAAILAAQGDVDQAKTITQAALNRLRNMGQPFITLQAQWLMGHLDALSDDVHGAQERYLHVGQQAKRFEMDYFQAKTTWALHRLPIPAQAHPETLQLSQAHQLLFERWENEPDAKHLPARTQLFNL